MEYVNNFNYCQPQNMGFIKIVTKTKINNYE